MCPPLQDGAAVPVRPAASGFLTYAHSHNDYEQDRPLRVRVEVDLWFLEAGGKCPRLKSVRPLD